VRGNVLNESDLVQHHDLGDEGDGLEPEGVAPHELPGRPPAIDDQRRHEGCGEEYHVVREVVADGIIGLQQELMIRKKSMTNSDRYTSRRAGWVRTYRTVGLLVSHQVDYEGGGTDEEDLHEGVVQTDIVHEKVQVPHTEDDQIHFLSLARQT
jgi:hypothetical protein